jgi:parvulin-like peptidyl-prolyl isomerase
MQKDVTEPSPLTSLDENTVDGILVTVAGSPILLSDLQQAILNASNGQTHLLANGRLIGGNITAKQAEQIFQSLINEKVLQTKAAELGLDLTNEELTQRINGFIKQQGYTQANLEEQLKLNHKSMEDYRKEFKSEILKQEVIGKVISPLVSVTNDEVKAFYLQQTKNTKQISSVKLRSLMIVPPEGESKDPLHSKQVLAIENKIAKKENFISLVKQYSMAVNASKNEGLLPPRPIQELPPALAKQLSTLNINDVAGPFLLGNSVFFFQYLGAEFVNSSDMQMKFSEWKNKLLDIKFNERLGEYLKNERAKLKINARPFKIER